MALAVPGAGWVLGAELLERRSGLHVIQQLCHAPRLWPRLREERAKHHHLSYDGAWALGAMRNAILPDSCPSSCLVP